MQSNHNKPGWMNNEDRESVIKVLKDFDLLTQQIIERVKNDNNIKISNYLDAPFEKVAETLYANRHKDENSKNKFNHFLRLVFTGWISLGVIVKIWCKMPEHQLFEYIYPCLEKAILHGNAAALYLLEQTWEIKLLPLGGYCSRLNSHLMSALEVANSSKKLNWLLDRLVRYSSLIDYTDSRSDLGNRKVVYFKADSKGDLLEEIPLLELLANKCFTNFKSQTFDDSPISIEINDAIHEYVQSHGSKLNFAQFKAEFFKLGQQHIAQQEKNKMVSRKERFEDCFIHLDAIYATGSYDTFKIDDNFQEEKEEENSIKILMWTYCYPDEKVSYFSTENFVKKLGGRDYEERTTASGEKVFYTTVDGVRYQFVTAAYKQGIKWNVSEAINLNGNWSDFYNSCECNKHDYSKNAAHYSPANFFEKISKEYRSESYVQSKKIIEPTIDTSIQILETKHNDVIKQEEESDSSYSIREEKVITNAVTSLTVKQKEANALDELNKDPLLSKILNTKCTIYRLKFNFNPEAFTLHGYIRNLQTSSNIESRKKAHEIITCLKDHDFANVKKHLAKNKNWDMTETTGTKIWNALLLIYPEMLQKQQSQHIVVRNNGKK